MKTIGISLKALWDFLTDGKPSNHEIRTAYGRLVKTIEEGIYYDFYNDKGILACMDGERVIVDKNILRSENSDVTFILSKEEYEACIFE